MSEADKAFETARERIALTKREGLEGLELTAPEFEALDRLPEEIAELSSLRRLDLRDTQVSDLEPLRGLAELTELDLGGTQVSDLEPLRGLTGLTELNLRGTLVSDLEPLRGLTGLTLLDLRATEVGRDQLSILAGMPGLVPPEGRDGPKGLFRGVALAKSAAAEADPEIGRIAEIEDDRERTLALFGYLGIDPNKRDATEQDVETQLKGPVLSDSIADVTKEADRFEATALEDGPERNEDQRYQDLLETLTFASARMAGTEVSNRIGREVAGNFADYAKFADRRPVNARLLNYLAAGIRAAMAHDETSVALDAFDLSKIAGFLEEHDTLVRDYHSSALRGPQFEVTTDPEVLVRELFPTLASARAILKQADEDGLFAPSVSDALEMLNRRAEGARKRMLTSGDPKEREQAVADLRRNSVLVTAYLGRIKGRLLQWTRKQAEHVTENPATTGAVIITLYPVAKGVIAALSPLFEALWKLIGNLPLPF